MARKWVEPIPSTFIHVFIAQFDFNQINFILLFPISSRRALRILTSQNKLRLRRIVMLLPLYEFKMRPSLYQTLRPGEYLDSNSTNSMDSIVCWISKCSNHVHTVWFALNTSQKTSRENKWFMNSAIGQPIILWFIIKVN